MFDKKVLVAGAGKSGICASEQLLRNGEQVVLFDENPKGTLTETVILEKLGFDKKPEALTIWLGALTDELLADISCMVISPGIPVDATKLQVTAVLLEQRIEIIALHDHVVKLQEAKSLLHTLLVAFSRQHTIDREMRSNLTQYLYIIQIKQPVRIIYHKRFSF